MMQRHFPDTDRAARLKTVRGRKWGQSNDLVGAKDPWEKEEHCWLPLPQKKSTGPVYLVLRHPELVLRPPPAGSRTEVSQSQCREGRGRTEQTALECMAC